MIATLTITGAAFGFLCAVFYIIILLHCFSKDQP